MKYSTNFSLFDSIIISSFVNEDDDDNHIDLCRNALKQQQQQHNNRKSDEPLIYEDQPEQERRIRKRRENNNNNNKTDTNKILKKTEKFLNFMLRNWALRDIPHLVSTNGGDSSKQPLWLMLPYTLLLFEIFHSLNWWLFWLMSIANSTTTGRLTYNCRYTIYSLGSLFSLVLALTRNTTDDICFFNAINGAWASIKLRN